MSTLPPDPFEPGGIAGFMERFRNKEISSEAATRAYLQRIELLDPKLQAFEHVAIGLAIERVSGKPPLPDLYGFLD